MLGVGFAASPISPRRTSPVSTRGASARTSSIWASVFATPTSSRSSRPSVCVTRARRRLPVTVLRPSIIVGERDSGWTQSFNVLYWPLRAFSRGAYVALPARRDAPVDVVSVDYVADAIFALSQAPEAEGVTYHLTAGSNATSVGELVELAAAYFRRPAPRLISPGVYRRLVHPLLLQAIRDERGRRALSRSEVFFPYFAMAVTFDDRRSRVALRGSRHRAHTAAPLLRAAASSSRSPPSGGGGRYHEQVSSAPPRPSHTTASPGSGAPRASAARDRVAGAWRKAPPARAGSARSMTSSSRLSALDASFLAVETPTAHMHVGWAATLVSSRAGPTSELPAAARSHRAAAGARAALPPEARTRPARPARAGVGRRPGVLRRSSRLPGTRPARRPRR